MLTKHMKKKLAVKYRHMSPIKPIIQYEQETVSKVKMKTKAIYIYIYIYPWDWVSIPYHRLKKMYLMSSCLTLCIIRYRSRVKWTNSREGVAPSPTSRCSSYWKGSFWVAFNYSCQLYLFICRYICKHIYVYIYTFTK